LVQLKDVYYVILFIVLQCKPAVSTLLVLVLPNLLLVPPSLLLVLVSFWFYLFTSGSTYLLLVLPIYFWFYLYTSGYT